MSTYTMLVSAISKPTIASGLTYALYSYKDESSAL